LNVQGHLSRCEATATTYVHMTFNGIIYHENRISHNQDESLVERLLEYQDYIVDMRVSLVF
jgi:hypothetical protein